MALQQPFTTTSPTIASYSYTDISEGTGIVKFFGCRASIDSTAANDVYFLTENSILPSVVNTVVSGTQEFDFDLLFVLPKTIKGTATFVIPVMVNNGNAIPSIAVVKYDGTTETTLIANTAMPSVVSGAQTYQERVLRTTIPLTHFAAGDTLRIVVKVIDDATTTNIYHNPLGNTTDFTRGGGAMEMYIPFKLDL